MDVGRLLPQPPSLSLSLCSGQLWRPWLFLSLSGGCGSSSPSLAAARAVRGCCGPVAAQVGMRGWHSWTEDLYTKRLSGVVRVWRYRTGIHRYPTSIRFIFIIWKYLNSPILTDTYTGVSVEYMYPIRYPIPVCEFCEVSAYHRVPDILMQMTSSIYIIPFTYKCSQCFAASTTNITLHLLAVHSFTTTGTCTESKR